jgi:hypothetical protein
MFFRKKENEEREGSKPDIKKNKRAEDMKKLNIHSRNE